MKWALAGLIMMVMAVGFTGGLSIGEAIAELAEPKIKKRFVFHELPSRMIYRTIEKILAGTTELPK